MNEPKFEHECDEENAARFLDWIRNRGGVAFWKSVNLSNPGASWSAPALQADGQPATKPTWQAENAPSAIYRDASKIGVYTGKVVETLPAVLRLKGMTAVLSKQTAKRLAAALRRVEKSHGSSFYRMGGLTDPAVYICTAGPMISLQEWADAKAPKEQAVA